MSNNVSDSWNGPLHIAQACFPCNFSSYGTTHCDQFQEPLKLFNIIEERHFQDFFDLERTTHNLLYFSHNLEQIQKEGNCNQPN